MMESTAVRKLVSTRFGQVHVRTRAGGVPILIFHINQQSSALQLELMDALAPEFMPLAMDYPSYGMSDHVAETPGIEGYAECAAAVLDSLGFETTYLVGEAVGTAVAAAFATMFPQRTRGIVLLNCPLMPSREYAAEHIATIRKASRPTDPSGFPQLGQIDQLLATNAEHLPLRPTQSWMDRINVALAECGRARFQASDALIRFDLRATLASLSCPTLLLTAEHSPFAAYREDVERTVTGVQSHVIPDCRFGMAWEQAASIAAYAKHFMKEAR
jgi:pimeloyl-ACP methyl ester carboxylesterase